MPVGVVSAATKNEPGTSEPRTWRTVRGIIENNTSIDFALYRKYVAYGYWNTNSEPPSVLKAGQTANFVAGHDSSYYGVSFQVGYTNGNHTFEVWAVCDANDPNDNSIERNESSTWKIVHMGDNGKRTNSYVVNWSITRRVP
ncbi:hypothetical protein AB0I60_27345 [Actinosynnema sp. NPDC050436]|uniref:hypothetical protein n=1 Tax=Actinosynnema sp. NPDC050436 TaxID=3155659 RepID=UPI0033D3F790